MHRRPTRIRAALLGAVSLAAALLVVQAPPASALTYSNSAAPAQFIAKLFSEAYGRVPSSTEWAAEYGYYSGGAHCNATDMAARARSFFVSSTEFDSFGYDDYERIMVLIRTMSSDEPAQTDLDTFYSWMHPTPPATPLAWSALVDALFGSTFFSGTIVPSACNTAGNDPSAYGFGMNGIKMAPTLPLTSGDAGYGTVTQPTTCSYPSQSPAGSLQRIIDDAAANSTVYIARKAVVRLNCPLFVKAGITLSTTGTPSPGAYAKMGRIVFASSGGFTSSTQAQVALIDGAKLKNVWVDGNRATPSRDILTHVTVLMDAGTSSTSPTEVSLSRLSNARGHTTLRAEGVNATHDCTKSVVNSNVITNYGSAHYKDAGDYQSDGIQVSCGNTEVGGNMFIDGATDVAIVVFPSRGATAQASNVHDNMVLQAGLSAEGAIGVDPFYTGTGGVTKSYVGFSARDNHIASSPLAHYDVGYMVGTLQWFSASTANRADGPEFKDNEWVSSSFLVPYVREGVATGGAINVKESNFYGAVNVIASSGTGTCPWGKYIANTSAHPVSGVWASAAAGYSLAGPPSTSNYSNCIGQ